MSREYRHIYNWSLEYGFFSIRRVEVKRFDLSTVPVFDVIRGASLLFGIGAVALP